MGPVIRISQGELVSLTTKVVQEHEDLVRLQLVMLFLFSLPDNCCIFTFVNNKKDDATFFINFIVLQYTRRNKW